MYRLRLEKPDGRELWLYSRRPLSADFVAPSPSQEPRRASPHLRWHPLRGEWVAYAAYRQHRAFLPAKADDPLAPTRDLSRPTELPAGDYDVAVFENLSPALCRDAAAPPSLGVLTAPARGTCEVVVFTPDETGSLGTLPLDHLELVVEVWGERTRELGARDDVRYVLAFENRGVEVGVTLHHPHGQIYAYPFVPPLAAKELAEARAFYEERRSTLLAAIVEREVAEGSRTLYEGTHAVAFVPAFARYPYEVWIAPRRAVPTMADVDGEVRSDLARALKTTVLAYDNLWKRPMPYLMAIHQAPTDGEPHPESHLHFEFSPALRSENRLKYLAGTELAAGMFANDTLPETTARELREARVRW